MSDSELSDAPSNEIPPDCEIQDALRDEVTKAAKGPSEEFTVTRIRKATETSLGLPEDFFKNNQRWKARSKVIIQEQVDVETGAADHQTEDEQTQFPAPGLKKSGKRSSPIQNRRPAKKQKVDSDEETSALSSPPSDSADEFQESKKSAKQSKDTKKPPISKPRAKAKPEPKSKAKADDGDEESDQEQASNDAEDKNGGSASEMSDVLDEAPPNRRQSKSKSKNADSSEKKSKTSKSKPKANTQADPDQEEIKKLQGWLAKCGVRKVWGKELKPFETSKAKIKHLKEMLADIGMTGRYSNDKAAQIKEARELAADIEAVQEGNERWGKSDDDNDDGDGHTRGGRRLVRGAKNYDFLSSDGEETD